MSTNELLVIFTYLSVAIMAICCVVINFHAEGYLQKYAAIASIALTVCSMGFLVRLEGVDVGTLITGQKLVYGFVTHGMYAIILFVFAYCKLSMPKYVNFICIGINLMISLATLTMNHHTWFYKSYYMVYEGGRYILVKEYGIVHTLTVIVFLVYMVVTFVVAGVFAVKNYKERGRYVLRMVAAISIPCLAYIIPKAMGLHTDCMPMALAIFMVMILFMIYFNNIYVNFNINMIKKWKIKMYSFPTIAHQPELPKGFAFL